jgi:cell division septation protein DedD
MNATATKPVEPELKCPRCGAQLAARQDWCLECGAAATTHVLPPPGWGLPAVIVGFAVLLAGAAFAITVTVLSRESNRSVARQTVVSPQSNQTSAPPTTSSQPATNATPTTTQPATSTAPAGAAAPKGAIAPWPSRKQGWTVIVRQVKNRQAAVARANQLSKQGVATGLLRSADYPGLDQGFWMVFSGRFPSQAKAQAASAKLKKKAPTNYVTYVGRRR